MRGVAARTIIHPTDRDGHEGGDRLEHDPQLGSHRRPRGNEGRGRRDPTPGARLTTRHWDCPLCNPALALGLLDAVKQERDNGVEIRRKHFVGPAKYLNRMGGITILDYLSREQVCATVQEYYATPEFESYTA